MAIPLLAARGHPVVASSGRATEQGAYLTSLCPTRVIDGSTLSGDGAPLQEQRWAGAVDSVGSVTLVNILAQTTCGGTVVSCGMAAGIDLPVTVLPFILQNVTLTGVNSVDAPRSLRQRAWDALAQDIDCELIDSMTTSIGLAETIPYAQRILAGQVRGRTIVDVNS